MLTAFLLAPADGEAEQDGLGLLGYPLCFSGVVLSIRVVRGSELPVVQLGVRLWRRRGSTARFRPRRS